MMRLGRSFGSFGAPRRRVRRNDRLRRASGGIIARVGAVAGGAAVFTLSSWASPVVWGQDTGPEFYQQRPALDGELWSMVVQEAEFYDAGSRVPGSVALYGRAGTGGSVVDAECGRGADRSSGAGPQQVLAVILTSPGQTVLDGICAEVPERAWVRFGSGRLNLGEWRLVGLDPQITTSANERVRVWLVDEDGS